MAKRLINICNHVQYGLSRCVTEILRSELGVLIRRYAAIMPREELTMAPSPSIIKEVYKILALAACAP